MKKIQAGYGIWTPAAAVLCYSCHGNVFPSASFDPISMKFTDNIYNVNSPEWINNISTHDLKNHTGLQPAISAVA